MTKRRTAERGVRVSEAEDARERSGIVRAPLEIAADILCDALTRRRTREIEALRVEAGAAGDLEQVKLCDAALGGDRDAWEQCMRAIRNARAMEGT